MKIARKNICLIFQHKFYGTLLKGIWGCDVRGTFLGDKFMGIFWTIFPMKFSPVIVTSNFPRVSLECPLEMPAENIPLKLPIEIVS